MSCNISQFLVELWNENKLNTISIFQGTINGLRDGVSDLEKIVVVGRD